GARIIKAGSKQMLTRSDIQIPGQRTTPTDRLICMAGPQIRTRALGVPLDVFAREPPNARAPRGTRITIRHHPSPLSTHGAQAIGAVSRREGSSRTAS